MDFFTADLHLGHKNIIKYCNRPFTSLQEMDNTIINNWNDVVTNKNDHVYVLGDLVFGFNNYPKYLSQLNGKIHLITGNHDDKRIYHLKHLFESISPLKEIKSNGQHIVLCHYGMRVWNRSHHGSWMLYGHSHGTLEKHPTMPSFDVGVDCWDFKPISFDQIKQYIEENY